LRYEAKLCADLAACGIEPHEISARVESIYPLAIGGEGNGDDVVLEWTEAAQQ
jgi:hypothetical protein